MSHPDEKMIGLGFTTLFGEDGKARLKRQAISYFP
jgi:hypothetical protein